MSKKSLKKKQWKNLNNSDRNAWKLQQDDNVTKSQDKDRRITVGQDSWEREREKQLWRKKNTGIP